MVQGNLSDVMSQGKEKRSMSFDGFAFRVILRVPQVTLDALTLESALFVDTDLRTTSRILTFVHIWRKRAFS
jgi:hypothetical protein